MLTYNPWVRDDIGDGNQDFYIDSTLEEIFVYLLIFFLLMYWSSIHISLKIQERVVKAKLLQFISGVYKLIFTITSLLVDTGISLVVMCIALGITVAVGRSNFDTFDDFALWTFISFFYLLNMISFTYLLSFLIDKHRTGESIAQVVPLASK
jgi:hypothetical protein